MQEMARILVLEDGQRLVQTAFYLALQVQLLAVGEVAVDLLHHQQRDLFMGDAAYKGVLQHMRERSVSHVVQQHGRHHRFAFTVGDVDAFLPQVMDGFHTQVHSADGVNQTCVNSARIDEIAHTQLLDAPQSLHIRMTQDVEQRICRNPDKPVHRVIDYFAFIAHFQC